MSYFDLTCYERSLINENSRVAKKTPTPERKRS